MHPVCKPSQTPVLGKSDRMEDELARVVSHIHTQIV